jgi:hypothetical protein
MPPELERDNNNLRRAYAKHSEKKRDRRGMRKIWKPKARE